MTKNRQSGTITVTSSSPEFEVSDLEPKETEVEVGETIDVSAVVKNVAGSGTADVGFVMGESNVKIRQRNKERRLDSGESISVSFKNVDTTGLDPGEYTHEVQAFDAEPPDDEEPNDTVVRQSISDETPSPGETIQTTVTIPIQQDNSFGEYGTDFKPEFAGADLVSATMNGKKTHASIKVLAGNGVLFISREEIPSGTLEFVYSLDVPKDAKKGDTYRWIETVAETQDTELEVKGPKEITVSE
jgi:hypothetical protein